MLSFVTQLVQSEKGFDISTPKFETGHPKIFIEKQSAYLRTFHSLDDVYNSGDRFIVTHEYSDGSWVALTFEHSCCSGEGFDCIVARDESGNIFINEGFGICGYESSGELFTYINAKNSKEFFTNSKMYNNLQFTKQQ